MDMAKMMQKLAETQASGIDISTLLGNEMAKPEPRRSVERQQELAYDPPGNTDPSQAGRANVYMHWIGKYVKRLPNYAVEDGKRELHNAVDLAAGAGVYTCWLEVAFNKYLEWTPTEMEDPEAIGNMLTCGYPLLMAAIEYQRDDAEQIEQPNSVGALFADAGGLPVRAGDLVQLNGLQSAGFNGKLGRINQRRANGRFAVCLEESGEEKAFKSCNLLRVFESQGSMEDSEKAKLAEDVNTLHQWHVLDRLAARVCHLDITNRATWTNASHLHGTCMVVTCTSLLTQVGYREPKMWQDTLELGALLLAPGGFIFQYDGDKHGGYGNVETMEAFIASKQLNLVFEERSELIPRNASFDSFMGGQHADGDMLGMVFWKV